MHYHIAHSGLSSVFVTSLVLFQVMVHSERIREKYQANYISARRFYTIAEIKEQLLVLTSVKIKDQIVTCRDYVLEEEWSMEMVFSGDSIASLAMYEV